MLNSSVRLTAQKSRDSGISLIETLIALAILAAVGVAFLLGLGTAYKSVTISNQRTAAESLAKSQLEAIKACLYDDQHNPPDYSACKINDILAQPEYQGYDIQIAAERLDPKGDGTDYDDGLQKITVTVTYQGRELFKLEGYKVKE